MEVISDLYQLILAIICVLTIVRIDLTAIYLIIINVYIINDYFYAKNLFFLTVKSSEQLIISILALLLSIIFYTLIRVFIGDSSTKSSVAN